MLIYNYNLTSLHAIIILFIISLLLNMFTHTIILYSLSKLRKDIEKNKIILLKTWADKRKKKN